VSGPLDKDTVRRANPIERVIPELVGEHALKVGNELKVRCPFHDDKRPSLRINASKGLWHCDPCGIGGDVFDFFERHQGVDFSTALASLADRAGVEAPVPEKREVASYDYKDETGALLYQVVRFDPKDFRQPRPDGAGGFVWNLNGTRRVVYRLPELKGREGVLNVEGEKDADRAWSLGLPATCNAGGAGRWTDELTRQLVAAGVQRVVVIPDRDEPGRAHAAQVARSCHGAGLQVRVVELPDVSEKGDLSDYLAQHTKTDLLTLVKAAPNYELPPPAAAASVTAPVSSADVATEPRATKKNPGKKDTAGRTLRLEDPEPWPDPVSGEAVLNNLTTLLSTFVVFADAAYADALALWIVHTYLMDVWWISPLAVVNSPTMRCGKTTLLQLVAHLASRALPASNISPAALFRAIERYRPTLILDEAETFLKNNEELRGLVNVGHTRKTAVVIRTVGEQYEAVAFSTWCAKFLALIGRLPATLMDRAIVIPMRRRVAGERVERLRLDQLGAQCLSIRRQIVRWAADHGEALRTADPAVSATLDDRAADNWRPLFAIADAAGQPWAQRARAAADRLHGVGQRDEPSLSIQLLADIRDILEDGGAVAIASAELVRKLVALEDRPWPTCSRGERPLTQNGLARLLKPFGIVPAGTMRVGDRTMKGYRTSAFEDVFNRYLPCSPPFEPSQRNKVNKDGPESAISQPSHGNGVTDGKSEVSSITTGLCYGVTDGIPPEGENRELAPVKAPTSATPTRDEVFDL
jgi:hypothetical protein